MSFGLLRTNEQMSPNQATAQKNLSPSLKKTKNSVDNKAPTAYKCIHKIHSCNKFRYDCRTGKKVSRRKVGQCHNHRRRFPASPGVWTPATFQVPMGSTLLEDATNYSHNEKKTIRFHTSATISIRPLFRGFKTHKIC